MNLLIIEDNSDIAENISDYFDLKGFNLDLAYDGIRGLELARKNPFDVIVLDIMLPGMSGFDVCKQLRKEQVLTPIIMLTARDQLDDKLIGFAAGADDYLVKPFSNKELEARILAIYHRLTREQIDREFNVADLQYSVDTQKVTRNGDPIDLNPTQKKILLMLMQASPKVVERYTLERQIWGEEPPDKDILRSHIYGLRSLIDKPYPVKLLHTVHGVGYRLSVD